MYETELEKIYKEYFKKDDLKSDDIIYKASTSSAPLINSRSRMTANGNVDDVDKLGDILRRLLNATWGSNWGTISPSTSLGDNPEKVILPLISYSVNLREIASGTSPKPTLMDTVIEEVEGSTTGDAYKIYRQLFDCIIEFNFYNSTSKDSTKLMNDFEEIIVTYSGYLKEQGLNEIFFLKEVPSRYSLNYNEKIPMKCCYFYVKLERNRKIRVSTINEIEMILKDKK